MVKSAHDGKERKQENVYYNALRTSHLKCNDESILSVVANTKREHLRLKD